MEAVLIGLSVAHVLVATAVCVVCARRRQAAFDERFPPISDAEFLARCKPGTNPDVALKVRRIVADALAIEYERVHPAARLIADLDCC